MESQVGVPYARVASKGGITDGQRRGRRCNIGRVLVLNTPPTWSEISSEAMVASSCRSGSGGSGRGFLFTGSW